MGQSLVHEMFEPKFIPRPGAKRFFKFATFNFQFSTLELGGWSHPCNSKRDYYRCEPGYIFSISLGPAMHVYICRDHRIGPYPYGQGKPPWTCIVSWVTLCICIYCMSAHTQLFNSQALSHLEVYAVFHRRYPNGAITIVAPWTGFASATWL